MSLRKMEGFATICSNICGLRKRFSYKLEVPEIALDNDVPYCKASREHTSVKFSGKSEQLTGRYYSNRTTCVRDCSKMYCERQAIMRNH